MVTTDAAHEFWTNESRTKLQQLAEQYERNVEITHPSGGPCNCPEKPCTWSKTKVVYPEYRGPSL